MKKYALLFILVVGPSFAHAQLSWDPDVTTTETPAESDDSQWTSGAAVADTSVPSALDSSFRSESKSRARRMTIRKRPTTKKVAGKKATVVPRQSAKSKPVVVTKPVLKPMTDTRPAVTDERNIVAAPAHPMILDASLFMQARDAQRQTQASVTNTAPYNLNSANYDFQKAQGRPAVMFNSSRPPETNECTDTLMCAARSYLRQTPEGQMRQLEWNSNAYLNSSTEIKDGQPLAYAGFVSKNFNFGLRERRRAPMCAKAVRKVLEHSNLIPKDSPLRPIDAKDYRKFLENFGFRHNPNACDSPGVVRVYDKSSIPQCGRRTKSKNCFRGRRTEGDKRGHVEILGTDRRYHHFTNSKKSIQELFSKARRPLIGCMVKESWRN